ncbi:hypothetical protein ARMSODRAFT_964397 [Armillaria solidipes]|uniref:Uncharacterized protein n=1 Tax=Armillaria solidipes TaxID=1076256 RepID=A0A2H3BGL9_9AGAR|nr:hypothetical protein ARMSODRAFT_964397 [Armillaria solidipes]
MEYFLKLEIFARYSMKVLNCTCLYRQRCPVLPNTSQLKSRCSMKYTSIPIEWPPFKHHVGP